MMRLKQLSLRNFRGFERLEVPFDERLTVLVGVNGSGKTSVLDATAMMLSQLLWNGITSEVRPAHPRALDVRRGAEAVELGLSVQQGELTYWLKGLGDPQASRYQTTGSSHEDAERLWQAFASAPTLVVYRRTKTPDEVGRPGGKAGDGAWQGALSVEQNEGPFFEWFREREEAENFIRGRKGDLTYRDPQLTAVRAAVESLLPGCTDLHFERDPVRMVIDKGGQLLEVDQLSAGEKRLLALCGDIAARLALLAPKGANALEQPAIVLIDEIEQHLHPAWQRVVLDRLLAIFTQAQFIVTTHSPLVLASVEASSIRLLQDFSLVPLDVKTRGRDVASLLLQVLGVPERPDDDLAELHRLSLLIDEERFAEARQEMARLREKYGESDGEMIRLSTLLRFLEAEREGLQQGARAPVVAPTQAIEWRQLRQHGCGHEAATP